MNLTCKLVYVLMLQPLYTMLKLFGIFFQQSIAALTRLFLLFLNILDPEIHKTSDIKKMCLHYKIHKLAQLSCT